MKFCISVFISNELDYKLIYTALNEVICDYF
ncbi:hypothetical protein OIU79_009711 [Salix purpurea]|uniref:Uncharacterized protein n=1 Tax=Salix purpurea TaxID=77065 RepID=A0A9Q0QDX0_SALPP|nr:hypothetical protein OIU79_009711 [Salix purpurea]